MIPLIRMETQRHESLRHKTYDFKRRTFDPLVCFDEKSHVST